jgi:diaminohydroxyphosphoribosylaminopyrimidine deaminase/5-amino-6-(5-phosphoribosylamino)uracil reductase
VVDPAADLAFMSRALFWAERGRGRTSPNPIVGAVVVSADGVVVGQGAHMIAGGPHAEVVALEQAGDLARGATLYCTLEPCSHTGRTGPCTERILAAGIRRVVVAVEDANPIVSGRGLALLESRGVTVTAGVGQAAALRHHAPFFTWVRERRPYVTIKAAVSRDGYVGRTTERVKITGPVADRYFHRQRAEIDALVVGSNTVLLDDPELTARGAYRARPLVRVIVDWRGRVPLSARVFSTLSAGPVIMVVLDATRAERPDHFRRLTDRGVQVEPFDSRDLRRVLGRLAERNVVSLLVEGGPALQAALADAELVDRAQWVIAPRELGGGVSSMAGMISAAGPRRTRPLGDDVLIEFDVHGIDRSHWAH